MRDGQQSSAWQRPWIRRSMIGMALVLSVGLLVQGVVQERDRLATFFPETRPVLSELCAALECTISPFRQIDSVVIESSGFLKLRGDVYRLNITLKNTSPVDIAAPSVELTLTDLQEQPMIRHVLSFADMGALNGQLLSGSELVASIPVHVKLAKPTDRISGYRLLAFYP